MKLIKSLSFYIIISIAIFIICKWLKSFYLIEYLISNIINLQVTLLAINTATLGLLASRIHDLQLKYTIDFSDTIKEMKLSLKEQIILLCSSIIVLILLKSESILFDLKTEILGTLLISIFVYEIDILWDTGKSVFVIIEESDKNK